MSICESYGVQYIFYDLWISTTLMVAKVQLLLHACLASKHMRKYDVMPESFPKVKSILKNRDDSHRHEDS
jgi:hypothetical protein